MESYNKEHITHVNFIMEEIHSISNEIYDSFADRNFKKMKLDCDKMLAKINEIKDSISNN